MDGRAPGRGAFSWVGQAVVGRFPTGDLHHTLAVAATYTRPARLTAILASEFHVTLTPSLTALPGSSALKTLINGIAAWALLLALAGLLIGAAMWALGSHSQNYQQSYVGKRAVLVSALAALIIGVAPVLINFFFNIGTGIVNPLNP